MVLGKGDVGAVLCLCCVVLCGGDVMVLCCVLLCDGAVAQCDSVAAAVVLMTC